MYFHNTHLWGNLLLGLRLLSWVKIVVIRSRTKFLINTCVSYSTLSVELNIHEKKECMKEWKPKGIHLGRRIGLQSLLQLIFLILKNYFFLWFNEYFACKAEQLPQMCLRKSQSRVLPSKDEKTVSQGLPSHVGNGQLFLLDALPPFWDCDCTCHKTKTHVTVKEPIYSSRCQWDSRSEECVSHLWFPSYSDCRISLVLVILLNKIPSSF